MPTLTPIGYVRSDFKEKFGTPRQPGLVPSAHAQIIFQPEFRIKEAFRGLEGFSHVWVIFFFHASARQGWHPTVRPPRLGGNERMGVFSTRSPFRPNPIGLSAIKLESIDYENPEGPILHLSGQDLIDGTPVLDIKPYLPLSDCLPEASSGFASAPMTRLEVHIPQKFETFPKEFITLLKQTLSSDPRPAYHHTENKTYGLTLQGYNVSWHYFKNSIWVDRIESNSSISS